MKCCRGAEAKRTQCRGSMRPAIKTRVRPKREEHMSWNGADHSPWQSCNFAFGGMRRCWGYSTRNCWLCKRMFLRISNEYALHSG